MKKANDVDGVFDAARKERAEAIITLPDPLTNTVETKIVELAMKRLLPTTSIQAPPVDGGGLMSYGPDYTDLFRRAAIYVDKIIKGRNPADLPVEQPTKFEFVINLKTAKALGLTIPQWVLVKADKIIR